MFACQRNRAGIEGALRRVNSCMRSQHGGEVIRRRPRSCRNAGRGHFQVLHRGPNGRTGGVLRGVPDRLDQPPSIRRRQLPQPRDIRTVPAPAEAIQSGGGEGRAVCLPPRPPQQASPSPCAGGSRCRRGGTCGQDATKRVRTHAAFEAAALTQAGCTSIRIPYRGRSVINAR